MKRQRISYSRKRKYDEMVTGIVKRQLIYNMELIDKANEKYHVFLYF